MLRLKYANLLFFLSILLIQHINAIEPVFHDVHKKERMIQELGIIKHHFESGYAPALWKKEYFGFDIQQEFEKAEREILAIPSISIKQYHKILRDLFKSFKDYHVGIKFHSTEASFLPFQVRGVEGKFFIEWIDPLRLPSTHFHIFKGDEILEFDHRPIGEVIADLYLIGGNMSTDQRLAEIKLTTRMGAVGDIVPKGPIQITTKDPSGNIESHQLHWSYKPERIRNPLEFIETLQLIFSLNPKVEMERTISRDQFKMVNPFYQEFIEIHSDRLGGMGSQKTFLPNLGEIIWSNKREEVENIKPFWDAYVYQHPSGYKIGFIRIPHYMFPCCKLKEFGEILNLMEGKTDALVIDQLNNLGGIVQTQYALLSMLTSSPLKAPLHRIKITQKEVLESHTTLEQILFVEKILDKIDPESPHVRIANKEMEGENQFSYQELMFLKSYCEHIISEWNEGRTLTKPTHITGVDKINPHPKYRYTKPIVMLIDELDFSGGDFVPAILQDNKRVVLFGSRTAGAGGYVLEFQFPNHHGIANCYYTASIAERSNLDKIENLGVTPDIEYRMTVNDLKGNYRGYIKNLNKVIESLLEK